VTSSGEADLEGVAATAVATARIRAGESRRPDRWFSDPLATAIARGSGNSGYPPARSGAGGRDDGALRDYLRWQVVVRTRYYDELVRDATAAGCRQVVLLAAGYDARAFRLDLPEHVTVFELDQASVLEQKRALVNELRLSTAARRNPVAVDFRADWPRALGDAGHDAGAPTVWLAEGLLVYLDASVAIRLLEGVTERSASGSRLGCEAGSDAAAGPLPTDAAVPASRLWAGGPSRPVITVLSELGWTCRHTPLATAAAGYGRPMPEYLQAAASRRGFVTAERRVRGQR
jgi:methyltransferase (TIGR00027 family)